LREESCLKTNAMIYNGIGPVGILRERARPAS
jgi:hypothetical protein